MIILLSLRKYLDVTCIHHLSAVARTCSTTKQIRWSGDEDEERDEVRAEIKMPL